MLRSPPIIVASAALREHSTRCNARVSVSAAEATLRVSSAPHQLPPAVACCCCSRPKWFTP
eukprot:351343-Prymnesium_polylepis.3